MIMTIVISVPGQKNSLANSQARKIYYNKSTNKNGVIRQAKKSMCPAVPPIKISGTIDKPNNKTKIRSI